MAKRKRSMRGRCKKVVLQDGRRRNVCWDKNGKIKSNTPVRGRVSFKSSRKKSRSSSKRMICSCKAA